MQIHAYLCFEGRAEEAIDYYKETLGAELVALMRGSDAPPDACCAAGKMAPDSVMHAHLKFGDSEVFVSDGMGLGAAEFKGFHLSLTLDSQAAVEKSFGALSADGQVIVSLNKTFFAESFGMVADKFGMTWALMSPAPVPASA